MIKNIITSIKRFFKRLLFGLRHKEGWASEFAKEVLSSQNGVMEVSGTRAFKAFVENIAKIEKSRISDSRQRRRIKHEKRILRFYGFAYRHPNLEIRLENEKLMKKSMAQTGHRPHASAFATI